MTAAVQRIELSRQRLRHAMLPPPALASQAHAHGAIGSWLQRVRAWPLIDDVLASVGSWWSHHPLRPVTQIVGEASDALVKPLAQRHPLSLVLAAALLGAALAWTRPWRSLFRSALFAGLVPQLASRVVTSLPIEAWLTAGSTLSGSASKASSHRA